jgi:hypothetical protein
MMADPKLNLPQWFFDFHSLVGVMADGDREGFYFWKPRDCVFPEDYLTRRCGERCSFSIPNSCVVFADYLQESWWYGLWTSGPWTDLVSPIWGADGDNVSTPIGTFAEFIELYLSDSPTLYPTKP